MKALRVGLLALLCLVGSSVQASEIKPFVRGSVEKIAAARQDQPFILAFWSLSCTHCRAELGVLSGLLKQHPALSVVLVSTDTPEDATEIASTLAEYKLEKAESWVFADSFSERLYASVDKKWRGELPRTYLFDRTHRAEARSGGLSAGQLGEWLKVVDPQL